ncbi:hypothetical protein KCU70_g304, partial [Aureobasidium melanogenum]
MKILPSALSIAIAAVVPGIFKATAGSLSRYGVFGELARIGAITGVFVVVLAASERKFLIHVYKQGIPSLLMMSCSVSISLAMRPPPASSCIAIEHLQPVIGCGRRVVTEYQSNSQDLLVSLVLLFLLALEDSSDLITDAAEETANNGGGGEGLLVLLSGSLLSSCVSSSHSGCSGSASRERSAIGASAVHTSHKLLAGGRVHVDCDDCDEDHVTGVDGEDDGVEVGARCVVGDLYLNLVRLSPRELVCGCVLLSQVGEEKETRMARQRRREPALTHSPLSIIILHLSIVEVLYTKEAPLLVLSREDRHTGLGFEPQSQQLFSAGNWILDLLDFLDLLDSGSEKSITQPTGGVCLPSHKCGKGSVLSN